ncbi:MAG: hypothetical protein RI998_1045 [Pseudomonadota bacterium]|jgi:hypothetical protein
MVKHSIFAVFLLTSLGVQAQTLCAAEEMNLFSCDIGKKVLSVCGSKDLSAEQGWMEYRFGTSEKLEMVYPEKRAHPQKTFKANRLYSSVEQSLIQELQFKKSNTTYTVYTQEIKGKKEAGVMVTTSKDVTLKCKSLKGTSDFNMLLNELNLDQVE